ncbi:hypothetical protein RhiirA1_528991 [Rhizophagus irregularis]|uniref:Ion transport domain-containing protein n=1 Tax=Rhizophagus irregularis TaxID=588596 RepID=A0A2N0SI15_9GLOM|nr:hypothetical protein RhiirA1_528991 [Rhizophagus irregularis]
MDFVGISISENNDDINKNIVNYTDTDSDDEVDKPKQRIDKPILEVSPDGTFLVTYNPKDHSIAGWNAKDIEEGQLTNTNCPKIPEIDKDIDQIRVSNDKKLAYTVYEENNKCYPKIIDLNNNSKEIELNLHLKTIYQNCSWHYDFNINNEFILYETKDNKWFCKKIYLIPEDFEVINISKYVVNNKLYLFSNNSIFEWDFVENHGMRIFYISKEEFKSRDSDHDLKNNIRISRKDKFLFLRIMDKIIIYSIELAIRIVSLDINDTSLYKSTKYHGLFPSLPLLFPLLSSKIQDSIIGANYEIIETTEKYAFGMLDDNVWKIKLEEDISKINFSSQDSDVQIIEDSNDHFDEHLNINIFNLHMGKIHDLFQKVSNSGKKYRNMLDHTDPHQDLLKRDIITDKLRWKIQICGLDKIVLNVYKKVNVNNSKWESTGYGETEFHILDTRKIKLLEIELLNDDDIIIITTIGVLIYHYYHHHKIKKSISLIYWNYMELTKPLINLIPESRETFIDLKEFKELLKPYHDTSQHNLPLPNDYSFKKCEDWKSYIRDGNKESFLKYGAELLKYAIEEHDLELIENIYSRCINNFKKDLGNNRTFLSIITSNMSSLNENYPGYVSRYTNETNMIIDKPSYKEGYQRKGDHLNPFQLEVVDFSRSIPWLKYNVFLYNLESSHKNIYKIFNIIQSLVMILLFPIFYILKKYLLISNIIEKESISAEYFKFHEYLTAKNTKKTPSIMFMVPYFKFINYQQRDNWFLELFYPQTNPFVETTANKDIYDTWNGEAIINFKWNTYGKYYYSIIWIGFLALLGCFTTAATIPQLYIDDDIRKKLFIASIVFGFIHLSFEVRQIIYNPFKWIRDFWNIFDVIAYVLPIYTSIYWLQIGGINDEIIPLLTFSCLFLDIKFLLFFRAIGYFGVYFAIIISVAKEIISFLLLIFIIVISFTHAFFILLSPRSDFSFNNVSNNNDPNNPWNLASTYNQMFDNGTISSSPFLIQPPSESTNMFIDIRTSLFATYLFLTGDSGALSNWSYLNNPTLVILIVLFSLFIVIYLMNLLIGLLSDAIGKNKNRVSYLMQKTQILAEIELFYMLPFQRRWKEWFPEIIYYYANLYDIQKEVKAMMDRDEWNTDAFPELKNDLLKILHIKTDKQNSDN